MERSASFALQSSQSFWLAARTEFVTARTIVMTAQVNLHIHSLPGPDGGRTAENDSTIGYSMPSGEGRANNMPLGVRTAPILLIDISGELDGNQTKWLASRQQGPCRLGIIRSAR